MQLLRLLLAVMIGTLLLMLLLPFGETDTRRMALAVQHHHDAPSPETLKEIADARRSNQRTTLISEGVLLVLFTVTLYTFIRAGKKMRDHQQLFKHEQ